jgi:hypothetical protein
LVIDDAAIRDGLRGKGKRYELDGCPLVIAAMPESMTFGDDKAAGNQSRRLGGNNSS